MTVRLTLVALFVCNPLAWAQTPPSTRVTLAVPARVEAGTNPGITVRGLAPNAVVRLHALRSLQRWVGDGGNWRPVRQTLHAFADFAASADGSIAVDDAVPLRGSYRRADPLGLLWSGRRLGDPRLAGVLRVPSAELESGAESRVQVALERDGALIAEAVFELIDSARPVKVTEQRGNGWHAVYARPADGRDLPVVVSLHGSEGGNLDKARGRALPLAARGFAAVALNYFAYPHEAIAGVPQQLAGIRLELLTEVRDWIHAQPEVTRDDFRLHGTSKGAEFALLAATKFDWITAVVAVVPTDVVWEGHPGGASVGAAGSSWSHSGASLPFVPLFPYDPAQQGVYRTNTERYLRSRAHFADRVATARIPIEAAKARILLLGSDRDEVWASGDMARALVERAVAAGQAQRVEVCIYPRAGHQLAGTGTWPVHLYGEDSDDPDAKDLIAEGEGAADAWRRTLRFLAK